MNSHENKNSQIFSGKRAPLSLYQTSNLTSLGCSCHANSAVSFGHHKISQTSLVIDDALELLYQTIKFAK